MNSRLVRRTTFLLAALATSSIAASVSMVIGALLARFIFGIDGGTASVVFVAVVTFVGACAICWYAQPPVSRTLDRMLSDLSGVVGRTDHSCERNPRPAATRVPPATRKQQPPAGADSPAGNQPHNRARQV